MFAKLKSGVEYCTLYTRADNTKVFYQDFSVFSGMHIGLVNDSFHNTSMEAYARQHNFSYTPVFCKTVEKACAALDAGSIPILAMTANAFTEDVTAVLAAGMDAHIAKPLDTQVMYSTIEHFFRPKAS